MTHGASTSTAHLEAKMTTLLSTGTQTHGKQAKVNRPHS